MWRASAVSVITKRRNDRNVLEWESRFMLGLIAAKNTDYIEKCSEQKLFRSNFPTKKLVDSNLLSLTGVS